MVYKLPIPQQQKPLPITGEIWENGGFERVSWRKSLGGEFPDGYSCENTAVRLTKTNVISGKYSLFSKGMGQSFVYSPLVSPPKNNCTIVFSVLKARFAQIKYEIWKFDRHGHLMSRKLLSNIIMPNDDSLHQFQIPFPSGSWKRRDTAGMSSSSHSRKDTGRNRVPSCP